MDKIEAKICTVLCVLTNIFQYSKSWIKYNAGDAKFSWILSCLVDFLDQSFQNFQNKTVEIMTCAKKGLGQ